MPNELITGATKATAANFLMKLRRDGSIDPRGSRSWSVIGAEYHMARRPCTVRESIRS
jgi:hypothetical protein